MTDAVSDAEQEQFCRPQAGLLATMPSAERWRALVRRRQDQRRRLTANAEPAQRLSPADEAQLHSAQLEKATSSDPIVDYMVHRARGATVLDIGSGVGRFALPMSAVATSITAVDPNSEALALLLRGLTPPLTCRVNTLPNRWEECDVGGFDIGLCAFVIDNIADAAPFLLKMTRAVSEAYLMMQATSPALMYSTLWQQFHTEPWEPGPSYLDVVRILSDAGVEVHVDIVFGGTDKRAGLSGARYATVEEAVDVYVALLLLDRTGHAQDRLRALLPYWLVHRNDGLYDPTTPGAFAVIKWAGSRRPHALPTSWHEANWALHPGSI